MTYIILPMAGEGSRFVKAGYETPKPLLPVTYHRDLSEQRLAIASVYDLYPQLYYQTLQGKQQEVIDIIPIQRAHHGLGTLQAMFEPLAATTRPVVIQELTEGQASTCLLAKPLINNLDREVFVGACDTGMIYNDDEFNSIKWNYDAIVFAFRANEAIAKNPKAYGYVETQTPITHNHYLAKRVSVKQPISETIIGDLVVSGNFWFSNAFVAFQAIEALIRANDRVNNEYYLDSACNYLPQGMKLGVFVIDRYIGWGTPSDYEAYQNTIQYWANFVKQEGLNAV